jgi:hypothetical protein
VEYLLRKPFLFDLTRVFHGGAPNHHFEKLSNQKEYVSIDDLELKCVKYSPSWIYVLSRDLVQDIQNSWTFIVDGGIYGGTFSSLYFGLCRVNNNSTTGQIVESAVILCECVEAMKRGRFFCHINKFDEESEIQGKVQFFDDKSTTVDFRLKINADDLYFFVTTGYLLQQTRVINPPCL